MAEEYSWDVIGCNLRILFSGNDFDLSNVGPTFGYKDFEIIFFNLFFMIDSIECRRKFRSFRPARNPEEQTRFIEQAVKFINEKKLSSSIVTVSKLRMCRGEPFRRLLSSLIDKAAESEVTFLSKKLGYGEVPSDDKCTTELINEERALLRSKMVELGESMAKLNSQQETLAKCKNERNEIMKSNVFDSEANTLDFGDNRVKTIRKRLVKRLEASNARIGIAAEEIKNIELPHDESANINETPVGKGNTSRRLSHFIQEMRECLTLTPEVNKKSEVATTDDILMHLSEYDVGIDDLISLWEVEQKRRDEAFLKSPPMQERYEFFEQLIPNIAALIKPIDIKGIINKFSK